MKISEAILLAMLAIFSLVLLVSSLDMPYGTEQTFGPGFLPLNLSDRPVWRRSALVTVKGVVAARKAPRRHARSPSRREPRIGKAEVAAKTGVLAAAIALVVHRPPSP